MLLLVYRNLLRRKARTALTVLGVASMVALTVLMLGVASTIENSIIPQFERIGIDLDIIQKGVNTALYSSIDSTVADAVAQISGVASVHPLLLQAVVVESKGATVEAGTPSDLKALFGMQAMDGRLLVDTDRGVVTLGRNAAEILGLGVGNSAEIAGQSFTVVGIVRSGTISDFDIQMPLEEAQRLFKKEGKVSSIVVKVSDKGRLEEIRSQIESQFTDVSVFKGSEYIDLVKEPVDNLRNSTSLIATIAMATAALAILNMLFSGVIERTREIGILMALGMKRRKILQTILLEAVFVGLTGGLLGIGLGAAGARALTVAGLTGIPVRADITIINVSTALIISVVSAVLGGLYPSLRAARMQAVEALRHV